MSAKSYAEVVEKTTGLMRSQFDTMTTQAKELAEHAQKVATETAEPIKESFTSPSTRPRNVYRRVGAIIRKPGRVTVRAFFFASPRKWGREKRLPKWQPAPRFRPLINEPLCVQA